MDKCSGSDTSDSELDWAEESASIPVFILQIITERLPDASHCAKGQVVCINQKRGRIPVLEVLWEPP